jgi:predicted ATPase/class 3 adenylate cyclase
MSVYPSGTVTFLFTDIEGSTKLAQEHPAQWESLRKRHHEILQSAIESYNGYVFQIIGDAFCAAFHTASDALGAAAKGQIDLYKEPWGETPIKVRMGIHTGKAELQQDGEYQGYIAMSRVQRLMSAGHGGQVLISAATEELLLEDLPEDISLRDLGDRRLKDLIRPEHIYQLRIPGLPEDFPPLKTLEVYRHNLPTQLTSFVGRQKEIDQVAKAIQNHRLVTLTGPGGAGKTRLSLQVAADMLDQFSDGVWFVELAAITNAELAPKMILSAFGIVEQGQDIIRQLAEYLRGKNLLLVLDNCEHLVEACAQLADMLLNQVHSLKILATSREALGVMGETTWSIPSLSLPDVKRLPAIEQLTQYEAVQLFIERANLVQPNFAVRNDNAAYIAQICTRLDGIPLAIELAASRVRALSVDQIASRLEDRLRLLTGGRRTARPRQQTLRATIDWSYDLLSEPERSLLRGLSIFSGGWTLEAAERACLQNESESDIIDLMTRLVDKSLVVMYEGLGHTRYRMLETTRQYALEKLTELGEDQTAYINHFSYYLQLAEEAENQLIGPDQAKWLNQLEREHDNFRTALEWSIKQGKNQDALRMSSALGLFWLKHSHFSEGIRWFERVLERGHDLPEQGKVKAWRWAGFLTFWQQNLAAARRIYTQNLEREEELGDKWGIAFSLHMLANIAIAEGNVKDGRELHNKSIALSREINAVWVLALAQFSLGYCELLEGHLAIAEELCSESLKHFRSLGEKFGMGQVLSNLGFVMCTKGDFVSAKTIFLEALNLSMEMGDRFGVIGILTGLAGVLQNEGKRVTSTRLQGAIVRIEREIATTQLLFPIEHEMFESTAKVLQESMGAEAYQRELETGMSLNLDEVLRLVSEGN